MVNMIRKLFILPYFGNLPPWFEQWKENFEAQLRPAGYDYLLDTDIESFKARVKSKLGIDYPGLPGAGKVWDYRCALGYLYEEEISGYDFWAHTDFDCVYGDVGKYITDELLNSLDLYSGHNTYVCGCWSLYRNTKPVNKLFIKITGWEDFLNNEHPNGWVETVYSRALERSGLRYMYTFNQGNPWLMAPNLKLENGKLYQDGEEIMFFHFRHSKVWPKLLSEERLRPMTIADADKMLTWKNYPETRQFAIASHEEIKREDHLQWLEKIFNISKSFATETRPLAPSGFRTTKSASGLIASSGKTGLRQR
jgi:hypothetical protein